MVTTTVNKIKKTKFLGQYKFYNNEDVVDFGDDGNIFSCLDNDEQSFKNIDFEDDRNVSSVLIEKLKFNCDDNDGLILFNEETVEILRKLYESFEKHEVSPEEVCNYLVIILVMLIVMLLVI